MQTNVHTIDADTDSVLTEKRTLWTVPEAAKFLRKSPRWLWSSLTRRPEEAGSVPHVRIGSSPRFFPEDLAAWVRAGCPPAATFGQWQAAENKRQIRSVKP